MLKKNAFLKEVSRQVKSREVFRNGQERRAGAWNGGGCRDEAGTVTKGLGQDAGQRAVPKGTYGHCQAGCGLL